MQARCRSGSRGPEESGAQWPTPYMQNLKKARKHCNSAPGKPAEQSSHAGTLKECNPDRVVLKKVVLSGYPVRVHKGKAVVRWMFHTAEDVRWFRPLQLWTRRGRHGHIQVSLCFQLETC